MSAFLASTDSLFAKNVQRQHSSAAVPAPWRRHVSTGLQQRLTGTSVLEALGDDTVVTSANLHLSLFAGRGVGENQIKIKSKMKGKIKYLYLSRSSLLSSLFYHRTIVVALSVKIKKVSA